MAASKNTTKQLKAKPGSGQPPKKQAANKSGEEQQGMGKAVWLIVAVIVVLAAIGGALFYNVVIANNSATNIATFLHNFNAAPHIAIFSIGKNGSQLGSAIGCSTALILQIQRNPASHRNASTISYFAINSTICNYAAGLGTSSHLLNASPSQCISMINNQPSIVIEYNATNSTVIKPDELHIYGNLAYMARCGVASEIS